MQKQQTVIKQGGHILRVSIFGELIDESPCIVLLHGGLDSLDTWKGFPEAIAKKTGLAVVAYERFGHGKSGQLTKIRDTDYRHHEAGTVLPALLREWGIKKVILMGHSDGGAIALMAAAYMPDLVVGICAIAPPLVPSSTVREGIKQAIDDYENSNLAAKLSVYHGDATEALFYGWANAWLSKAFDHWSCVEELKKINCPVFLVFGQADDYGYQESLSLLQTHLLQPAEELLLEGVGHMPHHYAREETIEGIVKLIKKCESVYGFKTLH